jgi:hypothetical protein
MDSSSSSSSTKDTQPPRTWHVELRGAQVGLHRLPEGVGGRDHVVAGPARVGEGRGEGSDEGLGGGLVHVHEHALREHEGGQRGVEAALAAGHRGRARRRDERC